MSEYLKTPVDLSNNIYDYVGTGDPSPNLNNAAVGSLYRKLDGVSGSTLWQKTASGWEALQGSSWNQSTADTLYARLANSNTMTAAVPFLFNNPTSNWLQWAALGSAAPAFTTRSVGTKLVYYPQVGTSSVDYATGIEANTLWNSVPTTAEQFKWYAGTTQVALLTGAGTLTLTGNSVAQSYSTNATAGNGHIVVTNGGPSNIGYIEWHNPSGVRQGYMGFGSVGIALVMEVGTFTTAGVIGGWTTHVLGAASSGNSYGLLVSAGYTSADNALLVRNATASVNYFRIQGDGLSIFQGGPTWTTSGWTRAIQLDQARQIEFGSAVNGRVYGMGNSVGVLYGLTTTGEAGTDTLAYWMTVTNTDISFPGTVSFPVLTTNSQLKVGTIEVQGYAGNNAWIGENVYFDGATVRMRTAGYGAQVYFNTASEVQFRHFASAAAGAAVVANATYSFTPTRALFPGYLAVGAYAGPGVVAGDVVARRSSNTGVYYFGDSNLTYLYYDGTNFNLNGGNLVATDFVLA